MNRRDWLRRAALIAGGVLAADQVELIEKLTPKRYVGGWAEPEQFILDAHAGFRVGDMFTFHDAGDGFRSYYVLSADPVSGISVVLARPA